MGSSALWSLLTNVLIQHENQPLPGHPLPLLWAEGGGLSLSSALHAHRLEDNPVTEYGWIK